MWCNWKKKNARRLARLDRFYLPASSKIGLKHLTYFIHGYIVGSDHSPVHLVVTIDKRKVRKSTFKYNTVHLGEDIGNNLRKMWVSLHIDVFIFQTSKYCTILKTI